MAFNAKNLTYNKSEPAFLQRIKAGYASQDGRNNVQHARPSKSRLKMGDGEDDDGPVILDEAGEVVQKNVFEGMMKGEIDGEDARSKKEKTAGDSNDENSLTKEIEKQEEQEKSDERGKQKVAEIGNAKKRKAVKVVGADEDVDGKEESSKAGKHKLDTGSDVGVATKVKSEKPKKKAKKIKLSFDEPE